MNKLLEKQIRQHLGQQDEELPLNLKLLLMAISASYDQFERDNIMLNDFFTTNTTALIAVNEHLRNQIMSSANKTVEVKTGQSKNNV